MTSLVGSQSLGLGTRQKCLVQSSHDTIQFWFYFLLLLINYVHGKSNQNIGRISGILITITLTNNCTYQRTTVTPATVMERQHRIILAKFDIHRVEISQHRLIPRKRRSREYIGMIVIILLKISLTNNKSGRLIYVVIGIVLKQRN